jgi:hypothetical protein
MPNGRGDIDLIAITPTGVYVIDAKAITGRVRVQHPWLSEPKLLVDGRDRTKLIDGLDRQLHAVGAVLASADHSAIPVHGVLCFTQANLPLIGTRHIRGHQLLYRKALANRLNTDGPITPSTLTQLARALAAALPTA